MISANTLQDAFPAIDPGEYPCGPRILLQLASIRERTPGGIWVVSDTRKANDQVTRIGKIVAIGNIAFRNRDTGNLWPEGVWAKVGDLVRIPNHVGQVLERSIPDREDKAIFVIVEDHQVQSIVNPDMFESVKELI